jgi:homocysteine S-methyltransferase
MGYRDRLPQLEGGPPFLTDGGLETSLIFHQGIDLPHFAAFDLLRDESGAEALRAYFRPFLALARERGAGFVLDTATWRANPDWAAELGYSLDELDEANRRAVALAEDIRDAESHDHPIVIDGVVGPRGDGYQPDELMPADEAERYHATQIGSSRRPARCAKTAPPRHHGPRRLLRHRSSPRGRGRSRLGRLSATCTEA